MKRKIFLSHEEHIDAVIIMAIYQEILKFFYDGESPIEVMNFVKGGLDYRTRVKDDMKFEQKMLRRKYRNSQRMLGVSC